MPECQIPDLHTISRISYSIGDFADTTEQFFGQAIQGFLQGLFGLLLQSFIRPFVRDPVNGFLSVSEDRQTELATEGHQRVVFCWDSDHVSRLSNFPVLKKKEKRNEDK